MPSLRTAEPVDGAEPRERSSPQLSETWGTGGGDEELTGKYSYETLRVTLVTFGITYPSTIIQHSTATPARLREPICCHERTILREAQSPICLDMRGAPHA
eukprot:6861361-Prymnesium_polylepis.1